MLAENRVERDNAFDAYVHDLIGAVLERLCVPFLIINAAAKVLYCSPLADVILADGAHVTRDRSGHIVPCAPRSAAMLRSFLDNIGTSEDEVDGQFESGGHRRPLYVTLSRFVPPAFELFAAQAPIAVVFFRDGSEDEALLAAKSLHGMSEAEMQAVRAVLGGRSLREHAELRDVSVHTVRKQFNTAMKKCGVSSKLQLKALVGELMVGAHGDRMSLEALIVAP